MGRLSARFFNQPWNAKKKKSKKSKPKKKIAEKTDGLSATKDFEFSETCPKSGSFTSVKTLKNQCIQNTPTNRELENYETNASELENIT